MAEKDASQSGKPRHVNDADKAPPRSNDPEQVKKKADQQQQDLQKNKPSGKEAQQSEGPKEKPATPPE